MMVLDTDHLSVLEWENTPSARRLQEKMAAYHPDDLGTTIINFEEQMRGWMAVLNKAQKVKSQIDGYRRLKRRLRLYCTVNVLEFDERAAVEFQRLKKETPRLGTLDLKIAAVVLANKDVLVSANLKDFRQVPGLQVENWLE
jgi:tRNA(fMet)-specific endonuclease VapC